MQAGAGADTVRSGNKTEDDIEWWVGRGMGKGWMAGEVKRDTRTRAKIRFLNFGVLCWFRFGSRIQIPMLFYLHNQSNTKPTSHLCWCSIVSANWQQIWRKSTLNCSLKIIYCSAITEISWTRLPTNVHIYLLFASLPQSPFVKTTFIFIINTLFSNFLMIEFFVLVF